MDDVRALVTRLRQEGGMPPYYAPPASALEAAATLRSMKG